MFTMRNSGSIMLYRKHFKTGYYDLNEGVHRLYFRIYIISE